MIQTLCRGSITRIALANKVRLFSGLPSLGVYKCHTVTRRCSVSRATPCQSLFHGSKSAPVLRNCSTNISAECSEPDKKILSVSPTNSGKHLFIRWDNGEESKLLSQWLRFNCQCPVCVSPSSNQRMLYADKLLSWPTISSATVRGLFVVLIHVHVHKVP